MKKLNIPSIEDVRTTFFTAAERFEIPPTTLAVMAGCSADTVRRLRAGHDVRLTTASKIADFVNAEIDRRRGVAQ